MWSTLHIADPRDYSPAPHSDYIPLLREAQTNSTRLRWWQLSPLTSDPSELQPTFAPWTLDNILIGGMAINPSEIYEDLSHSEINSAKWEFLPSGRVQDGHCGKRGGVLVWGEEESRKSATTCQMIVQEDTMLQFKVR